MSSNLIWIDTTSGTWGDVDGSNGRLVLVDLDEQARIESLTGDPVIPADLLDRLDGMGDSSITEFGNANGIQIGPDLTMEGLGVAVRMLMPGAQFEQDNDGQWIIYTGRTDES